MAEFRTWAELKRWAERNGLGVRSHASRSSLIIFAHLFTAPENERDQEVLVFRMGETERNARAKLLRTINAIRGANR